MYFINTIRAVDIGNVDISTYKQHLADGVVITHDGKILMQQRPLSRGRFGGNLIFSAVILNRVKAYRKIWRLAA